MSTLKAPHKKHIAHTKSRSDSILQALKLHPTQSYTLQALYALLSIQEKAEKGEVKKALSTLLDEQKIHKDPKGRYAYLAPAAYLVGRVDYVRPEYAYIIIPGQPKDVWVNQKHLGAALDNDLVKVRLLPTARNKRTIGRVVEIIERSQSPIIGRITETGKHPKALFSQKRVEHIVHLTSDNISTVKENDKVVMLLSAASDGHQLRGSIVQHLGASGIHEVEMHAIMAEFGLQDRFPPEIHTSLKDIPTTITAEIIRQRRDCRSLSTFTIDPEDAKDFDDALSYQCLANGRHQVGIHIADVSHYVLPDTLLDKEAYNRNTSIYLVDRCIPMLPELLSNELCSLRPNEDKLAFSIIFELDSKGKINGQWLGETVIHSNKRFSYEEAQHTIDAETGDFYEPLTQLNELAKKIRANRFRKGSINLETKELAFKLDANGKPLKVTPKVRQATHRMIEEFMLLANQAVATYVAKMKQKGEKTGPTFIYRTHDAPDPIKLNEFFSFVKQLGYKIHPGKRPFYSVMHELEQAIQGKQEANIIQSLAIRSMAKALYTTKPDPHFALAFPHYTHFTSPIRRYSDLLVHRLLKQYLQGIRIHDIASYESKCQYAIERESLAANAERASIKYKQVEWMQDFKDEILEGIISGITEWGIYVEITCNACEGMVWLSDLADDDYLFEERNFRVIGKRFKKCYRLGDSVKVKVKSCDIDKRYINFWLL